MEKVNDRLWSWAVDLDENARVQACRTANLDVVAGHVALMPDAHLGFGATVGSVVPTAGAVIPACAGVDLGCGMAAVLTDLTASDLPDSLDKALGPIERAVPAGVGVAHGQARARADKWLSSNQPRTVLTDKQAHKAATQLGTLGSGNHFVEVCLDESDRVWLLLHSGSRGIGNELASSHIAEAKNIAVRDEVVLEDPELAFLLEGTPEFDHYMADLVWSQEYAWQNREIMLDAVMAAFIGFVGHGIELDRVSCHHNYTVREVHAGREVWVTRKGAIRAGFGERGLIPGSMGAASYIVRGLGNPDSYESCAHGAGRTMSRSKARKTFSPQDLANAMGDRTWLGSRAKRLLDEHPGAYKDIDRVMEAQSDLVEIVHTLHQVLNYKGT